MLQLRARSTMPFPIDLDIPIFLYITGYTLFQAVPKLRQAQKPIPLRTKYQEIPVTALTSDQARYLDPWDAKLAAMNYRPVCTYRTANYGHTLLRTYSSPGDKALCTVMIVEVKVDPEQSVSHSCTL